MKNAEPKSSLDGQYLTFKLGTQTYGVPILDVREINQISEITFVPKAPSFVKGVINLRGRIVPVVDLKQKFGIGFTEFSKESCTIVIEADGGQVGMLVDRVNDVVELGADQIEPKPMLGDQANTEFILGMGKVNDLVVILIDVVRALSQEEFLKQLSGGETEQSLSA
jgi:purine-binding chemotaxis protein CheW